MVRTSPQAANRAIASNSTPRLGTRAGRPPIARLEGRRLDERPLVVGAVGVSGVKSAEDAQVARAGIAIRDRATRRERRVAVAGTLVGVLDIAELEQHLGLAARVDEKQRRAVGLDRLDEELSR